MMGGATMIKKIEKEIKKLEILKEQKINKRNQLDEELSEITTQLKEPFNISVYLIVKNCKIVHFTSLKKVKQADFFLRWSYAHALTFV